MLPAFLPSLTLGDAGPVCGAVLQRPIHEVVERAMPFSLAGRPIFGDAFAKGLRGGVRVRAGMLHGVMSSIPEATDQPAGWPEKAER